MCLPITGPAAIIAGLLARAQAQRKPHQVGGQGMAAIGIGLGVFNILLWTFAVIYYLSQDA